MKGGTGEQRKQMEKLIKTDVRGKMGQVGTYNRGGNQPKFCGEAKIQRRFPDKI